MTVTPRAQRAIIAAYFALLAVIYVLAWWQPAIGITQEGATHLVTAKALAAGHGYVLDSAPQSPPETKYPPLFPALLSLLALISSNPLWLKLLPLACSIAWLWLTRRLLLKMGSSWHSSFMLVGLTAAAPGVVFLSTNLLPETLFGLLATAALLTMLEERALLAGILAGLATLTENAGVALIAACIVTLVARRRFRGAALFAAAAMILAAPWFGWSVAHTTHAARIGNTIHDPLTIFTGLAANEKFAVVAANAFSLFAAPAVLLSGFTNTFSISVTVLLLLWCVIARRQMVPDLFVLFYGLTLLVFTNPPDRYCAPVLPLILWIVWRVLRRMEPREALAAVVFIVVFFPVGMDVKFLVRARGSGSFHGTAPVANRWPELDKVFTWVRTETPADAIVLSNMDALTWLQSGRKSIRGFAATGYELYYSPRHSPASPDQLSRVIIDDQVRYVIVTPDAGLPESDSFHRSVEALERGGVIVPVASPAQGYSIFRVAR